MIAMPMAFERYPFLTGGISIALATTIVALTAEPVFAFSVSGAIALYFIVWWIILFAVLPFGIRSQAEEGEVVPGSEPGAPIQPQLLKKALLTTAVACLVYALAAIGAGIALS